MLKHFRNVQRLYKKRLNLPGQQIGADVTSDFEVKTNQKLEKILKHLPFLFRTKLPF